MSEAEPLHLPPRIDTTTSLPTLRARVGPGHGRIRASLREGLLDSKPLAFRRLVAAAVSAGDRTGRYVAGIEAVAHGERILPDHARVQCAAGAVLAAVERPPRSIAELGSPLTARITTSLTALKADLRVSELWTADGDDVIEAVAVRLNGLLPALEALGSGADTVFEVVDQLWDLGERAWAIAVVVGLDDAASRADRTTRFCRDIRERGNARLAIELGERARGQYGDDVRVYRLLAATYRRAGDPALALQRGLTALALDPGNLYTANTLRPIIRQLGRPELEAVLAQLECDLRGAITDLWNTSFLLHAAELLESTDRAGLAARLHGQARRLEAEGKDFGDQPKPPDDPS